MDENSDTEQQTTENGTPRRTTVQSLPSDYSDVQPENYDPEFISKISNSMQVPDKIPVLDGMESENNYNSSAPYGYGMSGHHMTVPDRIFIAGGGQHVGGRQKMRRLDLDFVPHDHAPNTYVGLRTPPHTLTMDEQFPHVEDQESFRETPKVQPVANGNVRAPVPYTPGMSTDDSLLLNDEDEAALVRTQIAKLTRRINHLEVEAQKRSQRESMIYPALLGYFILKICWWMFRSKD